MKYFFTGMMLLLLSLSGCAYSVNSIPHESLSNSMAPSSSESTSIATPSSESTSFMKDETDWQSYGYVLDQEDIGTIMWLAAVFWGGDMTNMLDDIMLTNDGDDGHTRSGFSYFCVLGNPYVTIGEGAKVSAAYLSKFSTYTFGRNVLEINSLKEYGADGMVPLNDYPMGFTGGYEAKNMTFDTDDTGTIICMFDVIYWLPDAEEITYIGTYRAFFEQKDDNGIPYTQLTEILPE